MCRTLFCINQVWVLSDTENWSYFCRFIASYDCNVCWRQQLVDIKHLNNPELRGKLLQQTFTAQRETVCFSFCGTNKDFYQENSMKLVLCFPWELISGEQVFRSREQSDICPTVTDWQLLGLQVACRVLRSNNRTQPEQTGRNTTWNSDSL